VAPEYSMLERMTAITLGHLQPRKPVVTYIVPVTINPVSIPVSGHANYSSSAAGDCSLIDVNEPSNYLALKIIIFSIDRKHSYF
jgi:hypothetical protein